MFETDKDILEFKPKYPHTLPQDWKDEDNPSVYEVNATLDTLKKIYVEQIKDIKKNLANKEQGEENLRNIATNYQTIKSILFQPR
ncbi:hypothetical protein AZO1586I_71 [Bathymodiolus thermophilus thioautotrophic gill symbiont]|jgi:hypothetical protein|uniref:Uncharacterized protein n=3 Tax=sulfur-oxidizing symbionts TaxID=32036 RepID=A0ACA8ZU17_9GAMM|nr:MULTISPECIES: hypothetical protein [Gammaproteobacteria]CAC9494230.1 hypothetical protein [uncultured Gammaproteobacteria bacterium]CAB5496786.1 hypothetical protein AZO1586I_71 [Bathymodiolus thermophilus thioautotrophic gill symbiont]CAB5500264.1 hypothetical protein AZO1586R_1064 [Bathymodiolus azoricus thioautotrophic gill symbiont]CAC9506671.1 hypothetical protein [uncultured Gammaproteobacteria bacterium]CAC9523789.1 hypothetical protein [uncultured Gammaproteobacteria bacterium]